MAKDTLSRVAALLEAGADVLVVDTAHGHAELVLQTVKQLSGNILMQWLLPVILPLLMRPAILFMPVPMLLKWCGAGINRTTRVIAGIGVPQITAVSDVSEWHTAGRFGNSRWGIKYSGDITKALLQEPTW